MPPQRDPISVRTTRLNNIILGKGFGAIQKSSSAASRRSIVPINTTSAAVAEAVCREGLLDAFCLLYNECDKETLKKRDRNIAEFISKFRPIIEETRQLRVNVDDFAIKALIGKGYFGNVHLVVERQTSDVYAMKKIKKSMVTTSQVERDIMSRRNSDWLTNLQYAFQDNDNLYLIMEYLPGGDLLSLMSRHGPFDEDLVRFYLSELTLALHTLHAMGYVHRDIKPENILIDRFGHIKLADFGNAAALDRDGHVLSLSPVGTPDYIAPELLQTISTYKLSKSMHDVSCDYWSMGIIGYELICEITPFHEDNVHETYSKILSHCEESQHRLKEIINFPSDLKISSNLKNLICSLVTNPTNRLSYEQIVKHPFFETIQWSTVRSQVPPIIPTIKSDDDISNFEDGIRHKARREQQTKKSLTSNMKSNDFSGKDLPFIGYSFVHMESNGISSDDTSDTSLAAKLKSLQKKLKANETEIMMLKQDLLRAHQALKKTDGKSQVVLEAKVEIKKLQQIIKEKTLELTSCKTQIKTLQSSAKIDEEMWSKKEATITDLLRLNRQKYEEAKIASEQRYEKQLAEKKQELACTTQKLEARELEFHAKNDECKHLADKLHNYKEMLKQLKEQSVKSESNHEQQRNQLTENYEKKILELRQKLRESQDTHRRMTLELHDIRTELDESISSGKSTQEAKYATERSIEDILQRLNCEIAANNELRANKATLQSQLNQMKKESQDAQTECQRLERELQLAECRCNLAESSLASQVSPYETAPGSLTELNAIEDQLRADLEAAKESECVQKTRADQLQELVTKLEKMLERFNEQSLSPMKSYSGQSNNAVGDMLERQNEKLEDKLSAVREQMIVERQAARTANLSLWKVEKQLEEALSEKKVLSRRMELTEDRVKKAHNERDEAQRGQTLAQEDLRLRDVRIEELKGELATSKRDVLKEHRMWEKAEQERMKCKSEIIEHLANVHKLEQQATELRQKLHQTQLRCDGLGLEQKRLQRELQEERDRNAAAGESTLALQTEVKQLTDNFQRLKYACSITDNQLTEVEAMLETEQQRNKTQQTQLEACHVKLRERNDQLSELRKDLSLHESGKRLAEQRAQILTVELEEIKQNLQQLQMKLISQQGQLVEQTNALFGAQERTDQLETQSANCQTQNTEYEKELFQLKEENARILSDLFHSKDEVCHLQDELKNLQEVQSGLHNEIDELQNTLQEKEQFFVQRDIKALATLAQHKKLIDYLQLKVEDLSAKKKKTLADKIFGSSSNSKENILPSDVESSILYRALKEELRREQKHSKILQEQLEQLNGTPILRSPRKPSAVNGNSDEKKLRPASIAVVPRSPLKEQTPVKRSASQLDSKRKLRSPQKQATEQKAHHRFELALQESKVDKSMCLACDQLIIVGSPYWRCKECKEVAHRKCRANVSEGCGTKPVLNVEDNTETRPESSCDSQSNILDSESSSNINYIGTLAYSGGVQDNVDGIIEINCAFEVVEQKILLFGCNSGLFAYNVETQRLLHIAGIESVSYVSISTRLSKAIMVGANGEKLYQCDYRQLESRCQSAIPCQKPLETSVIELPFANRTVSEKWKLVQISNESENALDSVAIAATSSRIVILKYDLKLHKFKPVRALDTATPVTSIFYTRHSAIVSSDKFYEIDLDNYAAEEFIDLADNTLQHTAKCQPFVSVRISRQEFLLCFAECGVFVDEFGCRSRPNDLNWVYAPTGFIYREPFLYVSHYQYVQIIRLQRSYSKQLASGINSESSESPEMQRLYLPHYMPTLLNPSGDTNVYTLSIEQQAGLQQIYHLDALQAFKHKLNVSMETISSVATSVTLGSIMTTDSV